MRITYFLNILLFCSSLLICSCDQISSNEDKKAPRLSFVSPLPYSVCAGLQKITLNVRDQSSIQNIYLKIDGESLTYSSQDGSNYIFYWNTSSELDSSLHWLVGYANDEFGNAGISDTLYLYTDNRGVSPVAVQFTEELSSGKHYVELSWERSIDRNFHYYELLRTTDSLWSFSHSVMRIYNPWETSYTDYGFYNDSLRVTPWGLDEGKEYFYRIKVADSSGLYALSQPISIFTKVIHPVILRTTTDIGKHSLQLNWNLQDDDYEYHNIYRSTGSIVGNESDLAGTVGGDATSFVVTGLQSNTSYNFQVISFDSAGYKAKSSVITLTTLPFDTLILYQPSSDQIGKYHVYLIWESILADDFWKYMLFRSRSAGVTMDDSLIAIIKTPDSSSYLDDNLLPQTEYYYRLFYFDSTGEYTSSEEVSVTTRSIQKSRLSIRDVQKYRIRLEWEPTGEPDFSHYTLLRGNYPGFDSSAANLNVRIQNPGTTTYDDNQVNYSTSYFYKLYVTDTHGYSAWDSVSVTTLDFPPPELQKLEVVDSTSFRITWRQYPDGVTFEQYILYRDTLQEVEMSTAVPVYTTSYLMDTTFLDQSPDLVQYQSYYYRLYVRDSRGNLSPGSNILGDILNAPPVGVTLYNPDPAAVTSSSVPLRWSRNQNDDFWKFELYRSFSENIEPGGEGSTLVATLGDTTAYTVHGLEPGRVYYFRIFLYDLGNVYVGSNVVYAITKP